MAGPLKGLEGLCKSGASPPALHAMLTRSLEIREDSSEDVDDGHIDSGRRETLLRSDIPDEDQLRGALRMTNVYSSSLHGCSSLPVADDGTITSAVLLSNSAAKLEERCDALFYGGVRGKKSGDEFPCSLCSKGVGDEEVRGGV